MDKVNTLINSPEIIYEIKDIMTSHSLTSDQILYLLCEFHNISQDSNMSDLISLYNKGLLVKNKVNATLLFNLKKDKQLTLNLNISSKPNSTKVTLDRAHRIEKEFVKDEFLSDNERKRIADKYFKGDLVLAKYFIIFKSLFPVKNKKNNSKWNNKFGLVYDGMNLWDDNIRVAKKFIEIYKKLDIGIFLEATYRKIRDSIDLEQEKCFMTKPYKHLLAFDSYYIDVKKDIDAMQDSNKEIEDKINLLKV